MLDLGDLAQLEGDQRPGERGFERIPIFVERVRFEHAHDVVARELVTQVEHMRARRTVCQREVAHRFQIAALPEVEDHGDDLGGVRPTSASRSRRGDGAARVGKNDPLGHRYSPAYPRAA